MKILIWLVCILLNAIITVVLKYTGILLGGIPTALLFFITIFLANKLCKKWDKHKLTKKANKSNMAPLGFVFSETQTETTKKYEGIDNSHSSNKIKQTPQGSKLIAFSNISAIILSSISTLCMIVAMNVQDVKRNYAENWNTTVVYFVLLGIFIIFLGFAINSLLKIKFKIPALLSPSLIIATLITLNDFSVFSNCYYESGYAYPYNVVYYNNSDIIDILNACWAISSFLIFIIYLLPVFVLFIPSLKNKRYSSIRYREKCYKRVSKIHNYFEKGIISEEEYEKTKKEILKNILIQ